MTKNKGRGVFATRDFKKDELLVVEKPLAYNYVHLLGVERRRTI